MVRNVPGRLSKAGEVEAFIAKAASVPAPADVKGRLVFGIDATMSRQPAWDRALAIQAEMFRATDAIGGLAVQLVFFRGLREFQASRWAVNAEALAKRMTGVTCRGGLTQIERVLRHTAEEARRTRVSVLVYVGDAFEEDFAAVSAAAGTLALVGVKVFCFHEGRDPAAAEALREIAWLTGGVYAPFDADAPEKLKDLLAAAAVYAAGGLTALRAYAGAKGGEALRIARALE